jgi:hypothetical protein
VLKRLGAVFMLLFMSIAMPALGFLCLGMYGKVMFKVFMMGWEMF